MSNYGIRHDPKIITLVILSMLLPSDIGKKILKESNLGISEKTFQRIKNDVKDLGVEHVIKEVHKLYLLTTADSLVDAIRLKSIMFKIINDPDSNNMDRIKASQVIVSILKGIPNLYDPEIAESIPSGNDDVEEDTTTEANKDQSDNHDSYHKPIYEGPDET